MVNMELLARCVKKSETYEVEKRGREVVKYNVCGVRN
jgi:hypothetical protein